MKLDVDFLPADVFPLSKLSRGEHTAYVIGDEQQGPFTVTVR